MQKTHLNTIRIPLQPRPVARQTTGSIAGRSVTTELPTGNVPAPARPMYQPRQRTRGPYVIKVDVKQTCWQKFVTWLTCLFCCCVCCCPRKRYEISIR